LCDWFWFAGAFNEGEFGVAAVARRGHGFKPHQQLNASWRCREVLKEPFGGKLFYRSLELVFVLSQIGINKY
jgi:hypothetical protein